MSHLVEVYVRRRVVSRELINGKRRSEMPEYKIWSGMLARCSNPNASGYYRYGGRGIKVSDEWQDFARFFADMGARPSGRHSIDRIDNDGDYAPGNCRWSLPVEQAENRRRADKVDRSGPYYWSEDDAAVLKRMFEQYAPVAEIASVLGRSVATCRLRIFNIGLRRDVSISRLAKKHPAIAPVLREKGVEAFLEALKIHVEQEKREKERVHALKTAKTEENIAEILSRQVSRNEQIKALRLIGLNMSEIGARFGITRERVRQLQLANFETSGPQRKTYRTKPENRARHIDRLSAAWNRASAEARAAFLEMAGQDINAEIPLIRAKKTRGGFRPGHEYHPPKSRGAQRSPASELSRAAS